MKARRPLAWLASSVGSILLLSYAVAQPPNTGGSMAITHPVTPGGGGTAPAEPLVIHDPYSQAAHFVVRHLRLGGQGPMAHVQPGATVHATLEINEHCTHCPTPHNHILVGFQGQQMAAACAWSGLRESGGWRTGNFSLIAPMRPGVYPIRVRPASTSQAACDDATLSYWTRDLPGGPGPDATIGVIVVENPRPTTTGATPGAVTGTTTTSTTATTTAPTASAGLATTTTTTTVTSSSGASVSAVNASFEQPDIAQGQSAPTTSIPGWTRTQGSGIRVHDRSAGSAAAGDQWVELDGVDSSSISTEVATSAGANYLVTLAFSPRPGTTSLENRLEVRWNGELVATLSASGQGQTQNNWTRIAVRVRGTSTTGRLELRDAGTSNGQGTFVDDVAIVASP